MGSIVRILAPGLVGNPIDCLDFSGHVPVVATFQPSDSESLDDLILCSQKELTRRARLTPGVKTPAALQAGCEDRAEEEEEVTDDSISFQPYIEPPSFLGQGHWIPQCSEADGVDSGCSQTLGQAEGSSAWDSEDRSWASTLDSPSWDEARTSGSLAKKGPGEGRGRDGRWEPLPLPEFPEDSGPAEEPQELSSWTTWGSSSAGRHLGPGEPPVSLSTVTFCWDSSLGEEEEEEEDGEGSETEDSGTGSWGPEGSQRTEGMRGLCGHYMARAAGLPQGHRMPQRLESLLTAWRYRRVLVAPLGTNMTQSICLPCSHPLAAHIGEDASNLLQHVKFQSSNFENILTWDSGPGSTSDTVYSVEYKTYGESKWLAKEGCQHVTRKSCNLTTETGNLNEFYYARVTAMSARGQTATMISHRFGLMQDTTIKPPDVTCIPKVRSVQMIIHPTSTPIHAEDGHQLTLEDIFQDLLYRLELRDNHTYKLHLEGKQREYEFVGLTPDTEFLGNIMIIAPYYSKESAPYMCRVKTLPDPTWTYSFWGVFLFSMGFLVAVLCYLSYRYVTKLPQPPNSLNVQRVLTFQPLQFIQERIVIPALDLSGPSSLAQTVQYSQVKVPGPREAQGAPQLPSLPEITYFGQPDMSILQPHNMLPHQILSSLPYAPQAGPEARPPSYTLQATPEVEHPSYTPRKMSEVPPPSYTPQATRNSWPPSYGLFMEGSGKDSLPVALSSPKHLRPKGQLQKEVPVRSYIPGDLSLQAVSSLGMEEPQEEKSSHQYLGVHKERTPDLNGEPGTPGYLKGHLPLLASVQIEGHPVSLPLHTPSPPCSPSGHGPSHWGLLESLVCPKDESPVSKTETKSEEPWAPDLEQPIELESLFRDLDLTVQWEA
ncbi:interleukin-22 receptor subunit alpha-1 [Orycteropus afer afer]|uniref:Interleukin-22 receptor subunit alpha-1 n=1 Tax=Orycteropus afer afer TaxID=1230840 RepID=A0A8B6ZJ55_ORYAF|nr:interleukin-22 receptor subunit alpha-1 [Orycteropus afer afer]